MKYALLILIRIYQLTLGAMFCCGVCRFAPGCSTYATEAVRRHGAIKGGRFALLRICRCHPWGGSGLDPVP